MKKLFALVLAVAMMSALVACGAQSAPAPAPAPAAPAASAPAAAPADKAPEAPAPADIKWPERPIEIIIPYGAGGDTDFNARAYVEGLSKELGVNVVASNVTGAGGSVASRQVKDSDPDGYTCLFFHSAMAINEVIGVADFGLDDFNISSIVARSPGEVITVRADSGFKTLKDLFDYAQANPGKINVAMDTGTMVHVQTLMLQQAGFDVSLVDVGGASDRVAALAGGHVDVIINAYGTVKDYLASGEFVALAQTNNERSAGYPEIATAKEQGYELTLEKYYFFAFPKDTPQEIVDKFAAACDKIAATDDYAKAIMEGFRQEPYTCPASEGIGYLKAFQDKAVEFVSSLTGA